MVPTRPSPIRLLPFGGTVARWRGRGNTIDFHFRELASFSLDQVTTPVYLIPSHETSSPH